MHLFFFHRKLYRLGMVLLFILSIFCTTGCMNSVDTQPITFVVGDSLRDRSAIMIDIVAVTNPVLAKQLEELYPSGYFPHVDDLVARYNGQIKVWRFIASNQKEVYNIVLNDLPNHEYYQLFFFCAYPMQGKFCGQITDFHHAVVNLSKNKVTVTHKENS